MLTHGFLRPQTFSVLFSNDYDPKSNHRALDYCNLAQDMPASLLEEKSHDLSRFHIKGRRRRWHPTPVLLPGKSHGQRSLVGCSPWGCYKSDTTEQLHFHFSLACIGEGNGNPLQCSCLENPRDGGAWWAAICGVAQSWTRLSDFTFAFYSHALEKEMATHSTVLAWRIPGTAEPGGLLSKGSHRVRHD